MSGISRLLANWQTLVLIGILLVSLGAGTAVAQSERTGGSVVIGPDETHEGDLEVTGGTVRVEGTIDGNLTATGGTVMITGTVTDDLDVTAGTVTIKGTVNGSLTAAGGDVSILEFASIGGPAEISGGTITVDGTIGENTRIGGDTITIGPTARIEGDLDYSGETVTISDSAEISGATTEHESLESTPFSNIPLPEIPDWMSGPLLGLYFYLANLFLGGLVLIGAPRSSTEVAQTGRSHPLKTGGIGVGSLLGMPIVTIGLMISLIGIPLAFFTGYGFLFVLWVSLVYGGFILGTWLLSLVDFSHRWGALGIGLATVSIVAILPYGGIFGIGITVFGLGGFTSALYTRRFGAEAEES